MFEADRPILKATQDRLGRAIFAKYLARSILDHKDPQSLVIGLYGGWGVGKTSIINLTLEELRYAASNMYDHEKPIILNFSPWSYSGQNQLIYNFFRRLSSEMRQSPYFENAERIIHLLELYVSFFTHLPVPKALRPKQSIKNKLLGTKSKTKKEEDIYGWESGRDLTLVKAELNELLSRQKHKIIIIIDNVSRIEDNEIKQIFQIVKSMGDYANTVYLLSMDKQAVIKAVNRIYEGEGSALLEKIVQLPFEIPAISKQDLETILLDKLNHVVAAAPEDSWNSKYWADIYYSSLKHFFKNCRDITRYVNTVSFGFERIKQVTNPVDFFAITALEVFEPHIYAGIRDNKDLFTDLVDFMMSTDTEQLSKDKLRCDEILNRAQFVPQPIIKQLLIFLFPRLRNIYESTHAFYHSEAQARKDRRICSEDVFDAYFRLSMPSGFMPESEFNAILALATNAESFDLALTRLNQDNMIEKFLDLLDSADPRKIATQSIPNIINALMDNGDLFPEGSQNPLQFNTMMRLHRIFHQLLSRYDKSEKRFEIFEQAIDKTIKSLYVIIHELSVQSDELHEASKADIPIDHCDFTPQQLDRLKKMTVEKIKSWVQNRRLADHPKLIPILHAWKTWGNPEECKKFVMKMVENDLGLLSFLVKALKNPIDQAITTLEVNPSWTEYLANINNFILPQSIIPHAKTLFEDVSFDKMREREQLALLIFLHITNTKSLKVFPKIMG